MRAPLFSPVVSDNIKQNVRDLVSEESEHSRAMPDRSDISARLTLTEVQTFPHSLKAAPVNSN